MSVNAETLDLFKSFIMNFLAPRVFEFKIKIKLTIFPLTLTGMNIKTTNMQTHTINALQNSEYQNMVICAYYAANNLPSHCHQIEDSGRK